MDTIGRWTIAITVFFVVFGSSMVVAGTAPKDAPRDSPVLFETEQSRPGDRGLYRVALVVVSGGEGEYHDMNAQYAFERLPDRLMMDAQGSLVPAASFIGEWKTEPYELDLDQVLRIPQLVTPPTPVLVLPDCWPDPPSNWQDEDEVDDYEDAMDDCSEQWDEASDEYGDQWDEWEDEFEDRVEAYEGSIAAWEDAWARDTHIVRASDWRVTHHAGNDTLATTYREDAQVIADVRVETRGPLGLGGRSSENLIEDHRLTFTTPMEIPGPCGWKTSLQEGPQDMWEPILVHGECPADMFLGFADVDHIEGPIPMEVSGTDRVDGKKAVVFSTPQDEDRLRLWFTDDVPYPVRVLTRTTSVPEPIQQALGSGYTAPRFYVLHEMVGYEAGQNTTAPTGQAGVGASGQITAYGPQLGDFDHPWPLPDAVQEAWDHPTECSELDSYLDDHAAFVVHAEYTIVETDDPDHKDPIVDEAWTVTLTDGSDGFDVIIARHTQSRSDGADVPMVGPTGPVRVPEISCPSERPAAVAINATGTSRLPTVEEAAEAHAAWTGAETTTYGYLMDGDHFLTVGVTPVSPGDQTLVDLLTLNGAGGLAQHVQTESDYPQPTYEEGGWKPKADGAWKRTIATSGAWKMPDPATAATLATMSAGAGAFILLAPALKALLGGLGMFSRIRKEDLLDHPVRNDIMDTIAGDPGIHFQEIVRRIGKGRGTMEHHIRKMVAADLLIEKSERGFTCYFPKGAIDRHLMAAAPLLKADGARSVMAAIVDQPGTATTAIAEHLGMASSTVNYHVKKLIEAGLVDGQRQGRFVTLRATPLGDQAFGQFGRT